MSPRRAFKLAAALRFPQLRQPQPRHTQHPSLLPIENRRESQASEVSNSYLVETRRNRDIDASIRIGIELRYRESVVNQTYVFPRQMAPIQSETRLNPGRKHMATKSYDTGISPNRSKLVPETQQGIRLSSRELSSKAIRLRPSLKPKRLVTVTQANRSASRSKSPYIATSVSPLRTLSRSALRQPRETGRLRPQQSLRALRQRGPSPYDNPSSRSTDRLATLQ